MAIGDLFDNTSANNTPTIDKLNAKCLVEGTGDYLFTIGSGSISKGTIAFCSQTGSGFTEGMYYGRNSANTAWVAIAGTLRLLMLSNITDVFYLGYPCCTNDQFIQETSGGTVGMDESVGAVELDTNAGSNNYANIALEGIQTAFDVESKLLFKIATNANTHIVIRIGIAMDRVDEGVSTTQPHYGIAVDYDATGGNWFVVACDGTTRSATLSGKSSLILSPKRYMLHFTPGVDIKFYEDGVLDITKTTHIPSTGNTAFDRVFQAGVMTKEAVNKELLVYGMEYIGRKAETF